LLKEVSGHLYENTGSFARLHGANRIGCLRSHPRSPLGKNPSGIIPLSCI
jgi:hypothetical protein